MTLFDAIRGDDLPRALSLIEAGIDLDLYEPVDNGLTALQLAIELGRNAILRALLGAEANPLEDNPNRESDQLLHRAVSRGDVEILSLLIDAGASLEYGSWEGWTPLLAAIAANRLDMVRLLVAAGADIHIDSDHGNVLDIAEHAGAVEILRFLLDEGVVPHLSGGETVADLIERTRKRREDLDWREERRSDEGMKHLRKAARTGDLGWMILLLDEQGLDVNLVDENGETALHTAAKYAQPEIVKLLIEAGADPNLRSLSGWTPLFEAIRAHAYRVHSPESLAEVARLLLDAGADPNAFDSQGESPLWIACVFRAIDIIRLLLDAGADPDVGKLAGATPLALASGEGRVEVVRILLDAGADPGNRSPERWLEEAGIVALRESQRNYTRIDRRALEPDEDDEIPF